MSRHYDDKARQTLGAINKLIKDGINKFSVMIRHSERLYSQDPDLEPFMGLTIPGKTLAYDFGAALPKHLKPKLYTSFIGRCIETAYLIDKGNTSRHLHQLAHTQIQKKLSPFYINDIEKIIALVEKHGNPQFLRDWFDNKVNETIIDNPGLTSDRLCKVMTDHLESQKTDQIILCVSHDWNIYTIKEFKLGLAHETVGNVAYLEGIIFFERNQQHYVMGVESDPVLLS
ncbi:MAG: histidine phosphatase family protein [Desulfobacula sp.]|nr:histidine phosphatase family protein [Desulfobacula sp.]